MNYRHAFHAGNFADVFKHIVLVRILVHLREKPTPFRIIDTHAGTGLYDLTGVDANRTGEWRDGIARLAAASVKTQPADLIAPYVEICSAADPTAALRRYAGSPVIAARLLRPQDRLLACESEPAAAAALARNLRVSPPPAAPAPQHAAAARHAHVRPPEAAPANQAKVLRMDGWTALKAYVPPRERRGLVLIDPPYEREDDFSRLAEGVQNAHRKWPSGIYMLWYPLKCREGRDHLTFALRHIDIEKRLRAEIAVAAEPQSGLRACGIVVLNPPWKLAQELAVILPALVDVLGRDENRFYAIDRFEGAPLAWSGGAPLRDGAATKPAKRVPQSPGP